METFIYFIGVIIVGFGGILYFSSSKKNSYDFMYIKACFKNVGDFMEYFFMPSLVCFIVAFMWPAVCVLLAACVPIYFVVKFGKTLPDIKQRWTDGIKEKIAEKIVEEFKD